MHHSFHLEMYEKLRNKLDKAPIGMPKSPSGVEKEILKLLFTEEEASLALYMPLVPFTIEQLAERTGKDVEYLKKMLDEMAKKGTVWRGSRDGNVAYRLFPVMVGLFEMHFLPGPGNDPLQPKLAPLLAKYFKEAFYKELGDRRHPVMRALPERDTISPKAQILPYEDAVKLVKERDYHAIGYCGCRIISRLMGEGCRRSLENCLHFGSLARYMVEHGFARRITADEALSVLKKANKEGLVHTTERSQGPISTICNCCSDCCVFFRSIHEAKYPNAIAYSSYVASVDAERCLACGICMLRCPMKAVVVKKDREPAKINVEKCLGCGVCVPTCPVGALELIPREELPEVPDRRTYVVQLLADRGKDFSALL
ncbi:MAG: 4Fe-4S binding protein [Candidatus Nezhaarchaeales archaeon]|nr:MAG: (4Fe-4S)-binding protein [Candidatus Nezhaarchaeota archaeon WYZ-LMO8]TDA36208.1 MAG: (4Fe-4S)-binding protein [Candidatus Nezhaarchaeota archaeon WYZ-LMO7]